jgi:hypothetical protein
LPQLGQKTPAVSVGVVVVFWFSNVEGWDVFCLPVFCWGTRGCFERFFMRMATSKATITMITKRMMATKKMGENRKCEAPFDWFNIGVAVSAIVGVAVGVAAVVCVHHWFMDEASKADT